MENQICAAERGGHNLRGSQDVCLKNGSSQGQNLALTVVYVPSSLASCALRARGESRVKSLSFFQSHYAPPFTYKVTLGESRVKSLAVHSPPSAELSVAVRPESHRKRTTFLLYLALTARNAIPRARQRQSRPDREVFKAHRLLYHSN